MVTQSGTPFPPSVKAEARRLAAFKCCYCRDEMGDDVHHLVPMAEGGQGVLENAILLCVLCHDRFGHRSDKRAQLTQARDEWYEIVRAKYSATDIDRLANVVTKDDVRQLAAVIEDLADLVVRNIQNGTMNHQDAANVASTLVSSVVSPPSHRYRHAAFMPQLVDPPLPIRMLIAEDENKEKDST